MASNYQWCQTLTRGVPPGWASEMEELLSNHYKTTVLDSFNLIGSKHGSLALSKYSFQSYLHHPFQRSSWRRNFSRLHLSAHRLKVELMR